MNIALTLDQEQTDALTAEAARRNANLAEEDRVTPESILATECLALIKGYVDTAYAAAIVRLGEAARPLDYATRQALIAQVESQLNPQ